MARLVIQEGPNEGMSFEIRPPHFTMGRDLSSDVQLLYTKVSRNHAEIRFEDGTYVIHDKESRNGTSATRPSRSCVMMRIHRLQERGYSGPKRRGLRPW